MGWQKNQEDIFFHFSVAKIFLPKLPMGSVQNNYLRMWVSNDEPLLLVVISPSAK